MNLILQPCANKVATHNFNETIINKDLKISSIANCLSNEDYANLLEIYNNSTISVWGVKPTNYKKWDRISIGDIALFSGHGNIFAYGIVCYKMHSPKLAQFLWGTDADHTSWEYIYFLQETSTVSIPYIDFNRAVGYNENNVIQGLSVLSQDKVDDFLNTYPLASLTFVQDVKEDEYFNIVSNPLAKLDSVDGKVLSTQRKEQAFLRRQLFKGKTTARCSICGEEFPVALLCCSHIKKRCYCTLEEKKDYQNIVTPMCSLGCDKLFENGYIAVDNGRIKVLKLTNIKTLDSKIKALENKLVLGYSDANKNYYHAHLVQNSKK